MKILLFGGSKGPFFTSYLQIRKQRIADFIEKQIRTGLMERDVINSAKKKFTIEKFEIDIEKGKITDTHNEKHDSAGYLIVPANRISKEYIYTLIFKGDLELLNYRPTTYTGVDKEVEVHRDDSKSENYITVSFKCFMNNQVDYERSKASSIVNFYDNSMELNKLIEITNKEMDKELESIYKKVVEYMKETDEFNKRNNIIT
jgi:hypothetical protein